MITDEDWGAAVVLCFWLVFVPLVVLFGADGMVFESLLGAGDVVPAYIVGDAP